MADVWLSTPDGTSATKELACQPKRVLTSKKRLGLAVKPHERVPRTTQSHHDSQKYPKWVDGLEVSRLDEDWVDYMNCVRRSSGFVCLVVVMDVFTRMIRGLGAWRFAGKQSGTYGTEQGNESKYTGTSPLGSSMPYDGLAYVKRLNSKGPKITIAHVRCPEENGYFEHLMRLSLEAEMV